MKTVPALPEGEFTRGQARTIAAAYRNVTVENDLDFHCQLVIRDRKGKILWRTFNFDDHAGFWANKYLQRYGDLIRREARSRKKQVLESMN
ncbi:DUF905 family protein [Candidatus Pantoea multigeneris]|uniref:DUF905 domain-containing protein n=1 Tax=Candidatus Pantoea multigeneris TaxID=2608357 RepID=A0ABX0R8Z0_9GAMM|nr:DUF905 family protein [Pantoea multigeneris]NIF21552.1 DUF905 domain-containing protein [Pantoea multigeneris]